MRTDVESVRGAVAIRVIVGEALIVAASVLAVILAVGGTKLLLMSFDLPTAPWGFLSFVGGVACALLMVYCGYFVSRLAPTVYRLYCWYRDSVKEEGP